MEMSLWDEIDVLSETRKEDGFKENNKYIDNPSEGMKFLSKILSINENNSSKEEQFQIFEKLIEEDFMSISEKEDLPNEGEMYNKLFKIRNSIQELIEFPFISGKNIVAIGGGFSAGKSAFINSIIGEEILPTDTRPTTSIPTYILRAEETKIYTLNNYGSKAEIDIEGVQAISHMFYEKYSMSFAHIINNIVLQSKTMEYDKISFLDTPGYTKSDKLKKEDNTDETIARKHLANADYLLWVIDIEKGTIPQQDIEFISKLNFNKPIFFIFNKADKKIQSDIENIISTAKENLNNSNIQIEGICAYSAKESKFYAGDNFKEFLGRLNTSYSKIQILDELDSIFNTYIIHNKSVLDKLRNNLGIFNKILVFADTQDIERKDLEEAIKETKKNIEFRKEIIQEFEDLQVKVLNITKEILTNATGLDFMAITVENTSEGVIDSKEVNNLKINQIKEKLSNIDNIFPNISKIKLQENERYIYLEEKDLYFDSKTGIIFPNLENDFDSYKSQYKWEMMSDEIKKEVFNGVNSVDFDTCQTIIYVDSNNKNDIQDGKTWDTAYSSLQEALDKNFLPENTEFWVAKGFYNVSHDSSYNNIKVYGGFAGNERKKWHRNIDINKSYIKGLFELGGGYFFMSGFEGTECKINPYRTNAIILDSKVFSINNSSSTIIGNCTVISGVWTQSKDGLSQIINSKILRHHNTNFSLRHISGKTIVVNSNIEGVIKNETNIPITYKEFNNLEVETKKIINFPVPYMQGLINMKNNGEQILNFVKNGLISSIFNDKLIDIPLFDNIEIEGNMLQINVDNFINNLDDNLLNNIIKKLGIEDLSISNNKEDKFDLEGLTKEEFLIMAIKNEDLEKVKYAIKIGVNVNFKLNNPNEEDKETLLIYAIKTTKNIEIIKLLIEKITNVDEVGGYYRDTPLITAINEGQFEIAHVLIEKGADIKIKNKSQENALFRATSRNNLGIIELLIKKGADINTKNGYLETPLMNAAAYGQLDVVKLLLSKGADVNLINDSKTNVLFKACICANVDRTNEKMTSIFKTLLENGADYTIRDRIQATVLYEAYCSCPLEVINLLINKGLKIHQTDVNGNGPIFQAARNEDSRVLEFLLKNGYNPNEIDSLGNTALFKAVNLRRVENIKLLVKHGANVNYSVRGKTVFDEINAMNPAIKEKVLEALKR